MTHAKRHWRMLSSDTVYDNPWIRVEDHEVVNPSGKHSQYGKVCFKNRAVGMLALDATRNIYLVGQHRYTLNEYSWELPMGGAPLIEDPLTAAKRELREETGLSAGRWLELMRVHTSNSITDEVEVEYELSAVEKLRLVGSLCESLNAAEQCRHSREQVFEANALGQIVVGAQTQS